MRALAVLLGLAVLAGGAWWLLRGDDGRTRTAPRTPRAPQAAEKPEPGPDSAVPEPARAHHLIGRVLTADAGDGVAGATVRAHWDGGEVRGTTDDDGSYRIGLDPPAKPTGLRLRADGPDGGVALGRGWIQPAGPESRQPNLVLVPGVGVTFHVIDPRGAPVAGARLALTRYVKTPTWPDDSGMPVPVAPLTTGKGGTTTVRLAVGDYEVRAFRDGLGRTRLRFKVKPETRDVRVEMGGERRLKVIVRDKKQQQPVVGARVWVLESRGEDYGTDEAVTDAHGEALLAGLNPGDKLYLMAAGPGEPVDNRRPWYRQRHQVPPDVDEMVVEIDLVRVVSWEILPGDAMPAEGAVVPLKPMAGSGMTPPRDGVMQGGRLVVPAWPPTAGLALAIGPEKTVARLYCAKDATEGTPVAFKRAANVEVVLSRPDGQPAPGVSVAIFNQGNNLMAKALTGKEGAALLEMLSGQLAELYVIGKSEWERKDFIGTLDLRHGDVRVEHTLMAERKIEIRALLDGKPGLPPGRRLWLAGLILRETDVDSAKGVMRGVVNLPQELEGTIRASLSVPGYLTGTAQVAIPRGDAPIRHTFRLEAGGRCRVRVIGEAPKRLRNEFQQETDGRWTTIDSSNMAPRRAREEAEDGWTYTGLEEGRYRMRSSTGIVFGTVRVVLDRPAPVLTVDYARMASIRGRIEVPEGHDLRGARLELSGEGVANEPYNPVWGRSIVFNWRDGTFDVKIPGDRRVRLTAYHNVLTPDPTSGHFETTDGADKVVLRLVPGPTLRFRVPEFLKKRADWIKAYKGNFQGARVEMRLFAGDPGAQPAHVLHTRFEDGAWRAGGFSPGTYTVWIDVPEALPHVKRNVRFEVGETDLGEVPMDPGSTLRVKVAVKQPFAPPRIYVWARSAAAPRYVRSINSNGEAVVLVPGLRAGRFRVTASGVMQPIGGAGARIERELDVDGATDVELTLDLTK